MTRGERLKQGRWKRQESNTVHVRVGFWKWERQRRQTLQKTGLQQHRVRELRKFSNVFPKEKSFKMGSKGQVLTIGLTGVMKDKKKGRNKGETRKS